MSWMGYRMLSFESLGAWAAAGAVAYYTWPKTPQKMTRKEIDNANELRKAQTSTPKSE
eukprot:CAMPEP_0173380306 /NCGR_PEP_ID=MMETSP1356-20130122/3005_1 /TAXON_ID=77927 ORGANISM="Hemiselmis virescens, Strain PCC157" /NCGR_SAMPLE_ID=MMETSP1356 /ASSEMBLY_ACC=CAM_ASM_000847 /LENGTH=57 /DNA_ID=CAMNT_0014333849 /DNA_START=49 /DNA_END=222 /DNA_ORIENTATION=+